MISKASITFDDPCLTNSNSPTINDNEHDDDEIIVFKDSMNEEFDKDENLLVDEAVLPEIDDNIINANDILDTIKRRKPNCLSTWRASGGAYLVEVHGLKQLGTFFAPIKNDLK